MHFKHLKMTGFKSFAEPEEIIIDEGMTGVVGPNGCGKSNVVESLRWLMGESSARNMRASEIEDVVFSGTANRPSRNFAEVTLTLDNSDQTAPAHLNGSDEIQVTRKLDRGKGSTFRINGKVVRAKDVQLLFADMDTGSRSSGIVSQGRVDAIINAKPSDRRNLLEEAASISGLHQRRHDAELRLNSAENNLGRLDDILGQLEEQKATLVKQARKAARYRSVADRIRKAEALLLLTRFTGCMAGIEEEERLLREAEREVAAATEKVAAEQRRHDTLAEGIPPLREAAAAAAAELQRMKLKSGELDQEEARAQQAAEELKARREQITNDISRERQLLEDANAAITRLAAEAGSLDTEEASEAPRLEAAAGELQTARHEAESAEQALTDASAKSRSAEREAENIHRRLEELRDQKTRAEGSLGEIDLAALEAEAKQAAEALKTAEAGSAKASAARIEAEAGIEAGRAALDEATRRRTETSEQLARARAEADALEALLNVGGDDDATPVSSSVKVAEGFEDALAAALGEGLSAPLGKHRSNYWSDTATSTPPACPEGASPLSEHITAPPALAAALAGVGLVGRKSDAEALQGKLLPGQSLTTKKGGIWRWDGFVQPHGSESSAAQRLHQESRLRELTEAMSPLVAAAEAAEAETAEAASQLESLQSGLQALRDTEAEAANALNAALRDDQRCRDALTTQGGRHSEISQTLGSISASLAETEGEAGSLKDTAGLQKEVARLTEAAEEKRQALAVAMGAERDIANARAARERRRGEITRETADGEQRRDGASTRLEELDARMTQADREEEGLKGVPEEIEKKRAALGDMLEKSEAAHREAGDRLAEAENKLSEANTALRAAEAEHAKARESMLGQQHRCDSKLQQQNDIVSRIRDKLETGPEELPGLAGVDMEQQLDTSEEAIAALETRVERLIREREDVGDVNLLAEKEMEELEERVQGLTVERDDLIAAIGKLRAAISELNREGRERLLSSFKDVNRYFDVLFNSLFNGGTAELKLSEDEDPLEAGLEIYASPPGKKLQSLGLLSGGEKALTAIALIFAVFLTNPSPICILDEVDAPLDDNNVARFCDLLAQISEKTGSRFIVVTHHRLTMAKMDRLYGITMEEKGVSRIVSVDLQSAEQFKQSA